jgi:hypothetical protein
MKQNIKVAIITGGQPSTQPRIVKEADFFADMGFEVIVIGSFINNWAIETDKFLLKNKKWTFKLVGGLPSSNKYIYFLTKIRHKIYRTIPFFIFKLFIFPRILIRNFNEIYNVALIEKANLYISHNLGCLPICVKAAKKNKVVSWYDIEDFYRGQAISNKAKDFFLSKFIEDKYINSANIITSASPLISEEYKKLYPNINPILINNAFSKTEFQFKENFSEKVKFVWFSQNIAHGRGLELIIPVLFNFKDKIEITLIGNLYDSFYENFLKSYSEILKFEEPLPQNQLNLKLCEFDVGLAIELKSADFNRDICLTNKIFAYSQSGLFVLATDTQAQKLFIQENNNLGTICEQITTSVENQVENIINDIENIRKNKKNRFEYSKKLSWENESKKLVGIWKSIS